MSAIFPTYGRWDVQLESGYGSYVVDNNGKKYLDFVTGIAVCNLGHRHPYVQKAIEEQLNKLWHVSNLFKIGLQEEVAQMLVDHSCLDAVFFCNSGAEANEAAIKLARKYTQKTKIITFKQSFHGRTFATMSATGQEKIHLGYGPLLQEFVYIPYNDENAIAETIDNNTAAVMLEIVQGEGGVLPATESFLKKVEALCKENGALLIIDEVQTGVGRTGKAFAYEHSGISPDIVTLAKGLGNGFPVGAMLGKKELIESFSPGSHASTFGGNPLAMAAAKAVIETIFNEEFLNEVTEKGNYLMTKLREELKDNSFVEDIRGKGLMVGIQCKGEVMPLLQPLREKGLLIVVAGLNVLRLLPPLNVTKEEIDICVKLVSEQLVAYSKEYCSSK